jgi:hypothetical protein
MDQEPQGGEDDGQADCHADEQGVVEIVAVARRVIGRAEQAHASAEGLQRGFGPAGIKNQFLEGFHHEGGFEDLAVDLAIDDPVLVHDGDLRQMVESPGCGVIDEAQFGGQCLDGRLIGAEELPVLRIDALRPGVQAHGFGVVTGAVKADGQDREAVLPEGASGDLRHLGQVPGRDRAGVVATAVDHVDDHRATFIVTQTHGTARRVHKLVIAELSAQGVLAVLQCRLRVELPEVHGSIRRAPRRQHRGAGEQHQRGKQGRQTVAHLLEGGMIRQVTGFHESSTGRRRFRGEGQFTVREPGLRPGATHQNCCCEQDRQLDERCMEVLHGPAGRRFTQQLHVSVQEEHPASHRTQQVEPAHAVPEGHQGHSHQQQCVDEDGLRGPQVTDHHGQHRHAGRLVVLVQDDGQAPEVAQTFCQLCSPNSLISSVRQTT